MGKPDREGRERKCHKHHVGNNSSGVILETQMEEEGRMRRVLMDGEGEQGQRPGRPALLEAQRPAW